MTAAVRGGSPRASRTWSQRPKFVQGSLEPVASLVPPPSPSLPPFFLAFWGFPEWNTQDHPFLSLVCPWTTVRSWEHLPFSFLSSPFLSFSLSLFLSFFLSVFLSFFLSFFPSFFPLFTFLPPWVSLDAFVIAGNLFPLFLWCVLGRLCRSWEHLLPLSFLLFLFLFSPYSPPPVGTLEWVATRGSWPYILLGRYFDASRGSWPYY